jgi:membrane fusion protein (multidrug efflux system)
VEARVEELRRELAATESKVASANATVALLEAELAKRFVRAPVSGLIGEMRPVTVGAYLREGERFCSILPPSELRAVAEFRPEDAAGLVQVGQSAVLRIDGFPWTEFGTVPATVERVAKEPREGKVRVTLRPQLPSDARIRLEHGMTLVAEVQLERVTPLRLALRSAGGALRGKDPRPDSPSPAGRPSEGASP